MLGKETMNQVEEVLKQDYITIAIGASLLNIGFIMGSIVLYYIWHAMSVNKQIVNDNQPIVATDLWAVLSTFFCNVAVFIFGAFCWKEGFLTVSFEPLPVGIIVLQVVVLILIIDFLMYIFHMLAHVKILYQFIHQKHHEHIGVNALSLFVLSPFEAIGFGVMLLVVLGGYSFHYVAVGLYLISNVLWGTIGHFNKVRSISTKGWMSWLGTASFHNTHHLEPHANFGFYTTCWDRLFKTHLKTRVEEEEKQK